MISIEILFRYKLEILKTGYFYFRGWLKSNLFVCRSLQFFFSVKKKPSILITVQMHQVNITNTK